MGTMQNGTTIQAEDAIQVDEQNTQRFQKEEEFKYDLIREEKESENENGTEELGSNQKPSLVAREAEQDDPEKNLPASATEVQPPELAGIASNNDNMETIQQREEDQPAGEAGQAASNGEEEDKNNEE